MYPEFLKVAILGDDTVSWTLSMQVRCHGLALPDWPLTLGQLSKMLGLNTTINDTAIGTIRVPAENGNTEEMEIEVIQRRGF